MSESVASSQPRVELRQSVGNVLQFPVLIAIVLIAVAFRVEGSQATVVYIVCAVVAVLDVVFVGYLLRNRATLVITTDEITFRRRPVGNKTAAAVSHDVIRRVDGSTLSFRVAASGPVGSKYTGYVLKLRDNATGHEVFADPFGRHKVQQACEAQGWSFSDS